MKELQFYTTGSFDGGPGLISLPRGQGDWIGVPELFSGAADCVAYTCWHETPGKGPISDKNPAPVIEFLNWKAEQLR